MTTHSASRKPAIAPRRPSRRGARASAFPTPITGRRALVCAGGGVTGAYYEIGALAALEERLEGLSISSFDLFVGVSAGSYVGTLVASGVSPAVLYRSVTRSGTSRTDLDDLGLFSPNWREVVHRLAGAPAVLWDVLRDYLEDPRETTLTDIVLSVGRVLPSGFFTTEGLGQWVRRWMRQPGRSDDFRHLKKSLRVVAVELDTGRTRVFGAPGWDHVPVSTAVQASCAIPGLFRPVRIEGVDYVDGGLRKTAHLSLALEERCGFVLCVNPIVPIRYEAPRRILPFSSGDQGPLASLGIPAILDQVFRVTLHSRMKYGLDRYRRDAPESDVIVIGPRPEDLPRWMHRIMGTSGRAQIAEFAYRSTMRAIDYDFPRLARVFARHGMTLRPAVTVPLAGPAGRAGPAVAPGRLAACLDVLEAGPAARGGTSQNPSCPHLRLVAAGKPDGARPPSTRRRERSISGARDGNRSSAASSS